LYVDVDNILDGKLLAINKRKILIVTYEVGEEVILIKLNKWLCLEIRIQDEI
jgi:hypothetical protein